MAKSSNTFDEHDVERWKQSLAIHVESLHEDCAEHPSLYAEVAVLAARLKAEVSLAKLRLDTLKAKISTDIRSHPEIFELDKVTENAIAAKVCEQEDVKKAEESVRRCQKQYDLVQAFVSAFEHRRSMLNNEVALYQGEYWAEAQTALVGGQETKDRFRKERTGKIVRRRKEANG